MMCLQFPLLKNGGYLLYFMFLINSCTSAPEKSAAEKTKPKLYTVEIKQMKFQPEELDVQKGDTVVWTNHDIVTHDVTEEKGKLWTSGPLAPGQSWSLVVTESDDYYCSIHVVMKGKLIVE
jgi:plastocyanin